MAKPSKPETTIASEDGKADYIVTDNAPGRVAGRRVAANETISLTADEARAELLALHITPVEASSKDV